MDKRRRHQKHQNSNPGKSNREKLEPQTLDEHGLPEFFGPLLTAQYAQADVGRILAGYNAERATTLRANACKSSADEIAQVLDAAGLPHMRLDWYPDAFMLPTNSSAAVRGTTAFDEGKLYLQSLSSMIPPLVLGSCAGLDVLDMCAAPGGKTTQIAALSGNQARITACEMHAPRADRLEHNLRMQGVRNATVMRTDARRLDDFFSFDRILLDAPCSGSGTLHIGNPKVATHFTPALIDKSAKSQAALLRKALRLLKPGGICVYSTCSILQRENDDIVISALANANKHGSYALQPIESPKADLPLLPCALEDALTIAPTDQFEGFFVAKIKRIA